LALRDQEDAGLDIVSDGEQRRRHYIWGFLEGLTGTDTKQLGKKRTRGGKYVAEQDVARIVGEVTWPGPVMGPALAFTKAHTRRAVKVALPGPMTMVDTTLDEFYRCDEEDLAMRFAGLLNAEARALAAAGAAVVQFDDPASTSTSTRSRRGASARWKPPSPGILHHGHPHLLQLRHRACSRGRNRTRSGANTG
jgi:5-methyltetrahydropteroyltriglutamate--homocysteine methyltransferase